LRPRRAQIVYERLIGFTDDAGMRDALQFLITREVTHMKAFAAAFDSMGKAPFTIGKLPPTPGLVDRYVNSFLEKAQERIREWNELLRIRETRDDTPLKPQVEARHVNDLLQDDAIVTTD
jgi:Mn-containing catalase